MSSICFPDISPVAWEHPDDAAALQALRKIPILDRALQQFAHLLRERELRVRMMGGVTRVTAREMPRVDRLYRDALDVLDSPERYPLYLVDKPGINAAAAGIDEPFIMVHTEGAHALTDDELRVVLAHELGHVLSQHLLYKALLRLMLSFSTRAFSTPLGTVGFAGLLAGLVAWDRRSELSSDRAAALVAQSPEAVHRTLLLACGIQGLTVGEARAKLKAQEDAQSPWARTWADLKGLTQTHPQPRKRIDALDLWIKEGEYSRILSGEYPRRADQPEATELVRERARTLADGFQTTVAPIAALFGG